MHLPPPPNNNVGTTDQGKGKERSVVRPMGTAAYRGRGQGKGKGRGEGRLGQGGRGRSKGGEKPMGTTAYGGKGSKGRAANGDRPVGAASCRRDHHTMASCQNPPPTPPRPPPPSNPKISPHFVTLWARGAARKLLPRALPRVSVSATFPSARAERRNAKTPKHPHNAFYRSDHTTLFPQFSPGYCRPSLRRSRA